MYYNGRHMVGGAQGAVDLGGRWTPPPFDQHHHTQAPPHHHHHALMPQVTMPSMYYCHQYSSPASMCVSGPASQWGRSTSSATTSHSHFESHIQTLVSTSTLTPSLLLSLNALKSSPVLKPWWHPFPSNCKHGGLGLETVSLPEANVTRLVPSRWMEILHVLF